MSSGKSFRPITRNEFETADKSFRPITTADKSFRPIIVTNDFETDEAADKSFRPITRNEFETDEADKEVQNIISGHEDEERQAREAYALYVASVARTAREYHQREKDKGGFCVTQGGRIKNIFRNKKHFSK